MYGASDVYQPEESSLRMNALPCESTMIANVDRVRFTKYFSFGSTAVSPFICMVMVLEVSPGAKLKVPLAAVKSAGPAPPVAGPLPVAQLTVTVLVEAALRRTVNC